MIIVVISGLRVITKHVNVVILQFVPTIMKKDKSHLFKFFHSVFVNPSAAETIADGVRWRGGHYFLKISRIWLIFVTQQIDSRTPNMEIT